MLIEDFQDRSEINLLFLLSANIKYYENQLLSKISRRIFGAQRPIQDLTNYFDIPDHFRDNNLAKRIIAKFIHQFYKLDGKYFDNKIRDRKCQFCEIQPIRFIFYCEEKDSLDNIKTLKIGQCCAAVIHGVHKYFKAYSDANDDLKKIRDQYLHRECLKIVGLLIKEMENDEDLVKKRQIVKIQKKLKANRTILDIDLPILASSLQKYRQRLPQFQPSYFIVQKKNKKKMPLSVYEYPRCKPYLSQDQQQKYESYLNIINKSGKITDYF